MKTKLNVIVFAAFMFTFLGLRVFAQEVGIIAPSPEEITKFLALLAGIGGLKGAALAVVVIQGLMLFFRTNLADFAGKWKLLIVSGLSFVAAFVGILSTGAPWTTALVDGAVLAAFQVFANQIWKQVATSKGNV